MPLFVQGQDSTSKYLIGLSFSNDFCSRISSADASTEELKNNFDSLESPCYGFTTGMFFEYPLKKNFSLEGGIYYSNRGYRIDSLLELEITDLKFNFRYIELPIRVHYFFNSKSNWKPFVSMGVFTSYLINQKSTYNRIGLANDTEYKSDENLQNFNFGISTAIGFERKMVSDYALRIEGIYRQSITSISDTPLKRHLNSLGINLSLLKSF